MTGRKIARVLTVPFRGASKALAVLTVPLRRVPKVVVALTVMGIIPALIFLCLSYPRFQKIFLLDVCQSAAWAYLGGWIFAYAGKKLRLALLIAVAFLSYLATLVMIFTEAHVSAETLLVVGQTDAREVGSFVSQFVTPGRIAAAVVALVAYAALIYWTCSDKKLNFRRGTKIKLAIIFGALVVVGGYRLINFCRIFSIDRIYDFEYWYSRPSEVSPSIMRLDEYNAADVATGYLFAWWGVHLNMKELPEWEKTQMQIVATTDTDTAVPDSVNVVIIIGESFIKNHSNLYGYPLLTNPRLTAERDSGRLAVFTDYISTANFTSESLRNTLNLNDVAAGQYWSQSPYFPLLAARDGWRVHFYGNQFNQARHIADIQMSAMLRNPLLDRYCYEWSNGSVERYDGDFVNAVNSEFPFDGSVGNLDIYHLYGQHFAAVERYPHGGKHDRWTADSIPYERPWLTEAKKQKIAEYDNATLYNDEVVSRIVARYGDTPTVVLYFSDHGEEMYDASDLDSRSGPGDDYEGWLQRQFEIPFFVYASKSYVSAHPDKWNAIMSATSRPGMLDNIGQTVLNLCGMTRSPYYKPERDIISGAYIARDRVTAGRSLNYDAAKRRKK